MELRQVDKAKLFKNIAIRITAVFIASALGVLGAGAIVGVGVWESVVMAGILGVARVVERLARGFVNDGKLSIEEIDNAFSPEEQSGM
jgi:hypothetical protein